MLRKRLIIVGGKGGVGRSTVACALALALARSGRKTLLATVRCEGGGTQLAQMLGVEELGDEISEADSNLWAVNMNPQSAIREMGMMVLRFRAVYRAVLENRTIRSFLRAVPALDDYSMIGKAWYHTTERDESQLPRFDTVVFDGPATGHLISMLRIPQVILDSVPEGPLTVDARKARALLSDPLETVMLIVTMAEEMPASEARDLFVAARDELNIAVAALVVNQLYPDTFRRDRSMAKALQEIADRKLPSDISRAVDAAQMMQRRRANNDTYLERLSRDVPVKQVQLPHLFRPDLDRAAIEPLVCLLEKGLANG